MIDKLNRRRLLQLLGYNAAGLAALPLLGDRASADLNSSQGPTLNTRLTREYGVRYPFVGAGMGFVSMPPLVAAVSNAGGIGVLGNSIEVSEGLRCLVRQIRRQTDRPFGVDLLVDITAFGPATTSDHIDVCIEERVPLVVFHFNVPPAEWVQRLRRYGTRVWMQAASVEQAVAAAELGVDAIIAQGSQAGGHNKSRTPTIQLLHQIRAAVSPLMVLASGGIADGAGVVKSLANGAEGVWVGTRLVASTEAYAHDKYKERIVAANGNDTVVTTLFGPEYPNVPYRVLRNRVVDEWAGREDEVPVPPPSEPIGHTVLFPFTTPFPYPMPKFSAVVPSPETTGDFEEMGLPAGAESVKRIHDIKPAAEIIEEMMRDAERLIRQQLSVTSAFPS